MEKIDYIFVVLVYKNIDVLIDFFQSLKIQHTYKVIVVNSYYDDDSLILCKEVALQYNADFIPIPNKGFGYGNNIGTKYALEHYEFDYMFLSNSDINVKNLDSLSYFKGKEAVIAPFTHLPNGKIQNPNIPWRLKFLFKCFKASYDNDSKVLLLFSHIVTRTSRELFRLYCFFCRKPLYKIYSCHGSFIAFTKKAVVKLYPIFHEKMFLYNEELYLAEMCRLKSIPIFYYPSVDVLHLEGASSDNSGSQYHKESYKILYQWMQDSNFL